MSEPLFGSLNPFLKKYSKKRKLEKSYFDTISTKLGNNVCKMCLTHIVEGDTCSPECEYELGLRTSSTFLRQEILARDGYQCQTCGMIAKDLEKALKIIKKINKGLWKKKLEELKIPPCRANNKNHRLLDVDHILPVSHGGGAGILGFLQDNLEAKCLLCHDTKNRENNYMP